MRDGWLTICSGPEPLARKQRPFSPRLGEIKPPVVFFGAEIASVILTNVFFHGDF